MAQRRMISKEVLETDRFCEMPGNAQELYSHLILNADDDGMIGNLKMLVRMYAANEDDVKVLLAKGYLIQFEDGVTAITHWQMMESIRRDRYHPTIYQDDFQKLRINEDKIYELVSIKPIAPNNDNQLSQQWLPSGMTPAIPSIGKNSLDKNNLVEDSVDYFTLPLTKESNDSKINKIINYLNRKYSLHFDYSSDSTMQIINDRLNDGYTSDDFKTLINKISNIVNWKNTEERYHVLNPKNIFTKSNFEELVIKEKAISPKNLVFKKEDKVKGVINYINKIFEKDIATGFSHKLIQTDEVQKTIASAIDYFENDQKLLSYIRKNQERIFTPTRIVEFLNDSLLLHEAKTNKVISHEK
ncbi:MULTISPECIES: conserved phage C-terminal domain-containing protein [Lactobacillus]|uniref:conserved phage C-terminal domain-containing protein n=1 Tax=Lactobacillus TaxID=1578 RepID=UPI002492BAD2|nr:MULTISPECIES: conserved phage C-terminal domain-containing protein [Lactobacillus]